MIKVRAFNSSPFKINPIITYDLLTANIVPTLPGIAVSVPEEDLGVCMGCLVCKGVLSIPEVASSFCSDCRGETRWLFCMIILLGLNLADFDCGF